MLTLLAILWVPVWYFSMRVYRADIAHDRIKRLATPLSMPTTVAILSTLSSETTQVLRTQISLALKGKLHKDVAVHHATDPRLAAVLAKPSDPSLIDASLEPLLLQWPESSLRLVVGYSNDTSCEPKLSLGGLGHGWLTSSAKCSSFPELAVERIVQLLSRMLLGSKPAVASNTLPLSSEYALVFSLLHERTDDKRMEWEIGNAIQTNLLPMVEALAPAVTLRIETQIVGHAKLAGRPRTDAAGAHYFTYDEVNHRLLNIDR